MASNDLADFLLARIDEDEEAARCRVTILLAEGDRAGMAYSMRFSADRVLAECEARKRIAVLHSNDGGFCRTCADEPDYDDGQRYGQSYPCDTLLLLAWPYGTHPDWRDEWNPNPVMAG